MTLGTALTNLDEIYDDFIKEYEMGSFVEGVCPRNGDDALMGPGSLGKRFAQY